MNITLIEHPRGSEGWDNWNIAGVRVTAFSSGGVGYTILAVGAYGPNAAAGSFGCVVRLKYGDGMNTATFQLVTPTSLLPGTTPSGPIPAQATIGGLIGNNHCNS
jgi:hypothetical protein